VVSDITLLTSMSVTCKYENLFFFLLLYVVSDITLMTFMSVTCKYENLFFSCFYMSTLLTSMSVTCKYDNLFFMCFYGWLVIVLCRFGKFIFCLPLCVAGSPV